MWPINIERTQSEKRNPVYGCNCSSGSIRNETAGKNKPNKGSDAISPPLFGLFRLPPAIPLLSGYLVTRETKKEAQSRMPC